MNDNNMDTIYKVEQWSLNHPLLGSPSLLLEQLPQDIDEQDTLEWNKISNDDIGSTQFISQGDKSVSEQSLEAASRYKILCKLHEKFPNHLPFALLLAECHFLMNDTFGAWRLMKEAQHTLQQGQDSVLDVAVEMLTALAECYMDDDVDDIDETAIQVTTYSRPPNFSASHEHPSLDVLQSKWMELQQLDDGAEQYARLASATTNQFEGVFTLEGDSSFKLAQDGLKPSSIQGISSESRHKDPNKIIEIIQNTHHCFHLLQHVISRERVLDDKFLQELHCQFLRDDNINIEEFYGESAAQLIPMGVYRGGPCSVRNEDENGVLKSIIRFCNARNLEKEMQWFLAQTQTTLYASDLDPYQACAWIHHSYIVIHPFGDGNGRMARLISSIPLMRANLPPIYVSEASRETYFEALNTCTETGHVDNLVTFFKDETIRAIDSILRYNAS